MLFAVAGFYFLYKRNRGIFFALFIYFVINLYIVSSWSCWWYAQSFGQRALIQSYAVMALPLGYFIQWVAGKNLLTKLFFSLLGLFFIWLNLFQTWQMQHHILSNDRMTFAYYLKTFGKTKPDPKLKELLLINRTSIGKKPQMKAPGYYNRKVLRINDFENTKVFGNHLTEKHVHSGRYALRMDSTLHFTPSFQITYKNLTSKYYAWVKATVWVYPVHDLDETPAAIVMTFNHNGKYYHYKAKRFDSPDMKKQLKYNRWNKVEMLYLTPEVRNKNDILSVYIWNRGKKDIYFDDFKIERFEPKEEDIF